MLQMGESDGSPGRHEDQGAGSARVAQDVPCERRSVSIIMMGVC